MRITLDYRVDCLFVAGAVVAKMMSKLGKAKGKFVILILNAKMLCNR